MTISVAGIAPTWANRLLDIMMIGDTNYYIRHNNTTYYPFDNSVAANGVLNVALFTTAPDLDGTGWVEATGSGYARAAYAQGATYWVAAAAGIVTNAQNIIFPKVISTWGEIVAIGFFATGSTTIPDLWGTFSAATTPAVNSTPVFLAGDLSFKLIR
jgi:hypothetical protein